MAYFNPFFNNRPAPIQNSALQFNPQQFAQLAMTLNQQSLDQLVAMARARGISDADITAGLDIIKSLK